MEEAAQRRAASVRIGASAVPVKDRYRQQGDAESIVSGCEEPSKIYGQPDFCKGDCSELSWACANLSGVELGV